MTIKLQKYLAQAGISSRRKAEEAIIAGKVSVNGQPAHIGQRIDPNQDKITFEGREITQDVILRYFLVYKPVGYVSTTSDELNRTTVLSLLPKTSERLYPVGRLDLDSEGLMLLTNDGRLTQELTHPSREIPKTYKVLISGIPTTKALNHLHRGVRLKEGYTQPAEVEVLNHENNNTWLEITIHEGMHRQVRRMLERVGYDTIKLIRTKLGPFTLEMLENREVKELTAHEVNELMKSQHSS